MKKIIFSEPFFKTNTKFLVQKKASKKIESKQDLYKLEIGTLGNTTTHSKIAPSVAPINYQIFSTQEIAFDALEQNKIEAFVSDNILLQGLRKKAKNPDNYVILPKINFPGNEYYVVVFHEDNYKLRDYINKFIDDLRAEYETKLSDEGFKILLSEEKTTLEKEKETLSIKIDSLVKENKTLKKIIKYFVIILAIVIVCWPIIWILIYKKTKNFASLKYNKKEINIEVFLYTLDEFNWKENIIIDNKSSANTEEILFKLSSPQKTKAEIKKFEDEFNKRYEENKTIDNNELKRKNQENYRYHSLPSIIEEMVKLDKRENISITINVSIDNNKSNTSVSQKGNIGIEKVIDSDIKGNAQVAGIKNKSNLEK